MSGPGSTEQQDFGNPAAFFNNGPQQGGSGHDFFNQHHQGAPQQQNWYQQQSSPEHMPGNPQPPASAPMFFNPADYAKGAVTQPSVFNPYPQADATQQPPPSEMNQHSENYPNSGNQWYQQEKTEPPPPHSQGWDHPQQDQNYIYGEANTHELTPGHGHTADSYGQQPYYPQQPGDSLVAGQTMQGNGDHAPPNQWDQQPTSVAGEQEAGWNNLNVVSQLQNNVPLGDMSKSNESANQESKQDKVGQPIVEDDDSGSGYLGFFHNADNESDFAESDKNESAEDSSHQEPLAMAPRTCDENKAPDSQQLTPSIPEGGQVPTMQQNHPVSQHFQPGQELPPTNQSEIPPTFFHPPNGQHDGGSSASGNYPGIFSEVGEEGRTGNYPERGGSDIDNVQNVQQPFQQDILEGPYLQNQFPPPQTNSQDGFDTRQAPAAELQTSDGGSEVEPPSEHSSITGSLPPSDPSASSSTSRSNSLLGEAGGSTVPSTGITTSASHENFPVESSKEIVMQEQRENVAASGGESLPHVVLNNQGEVSESTAVTSPQLQIGIPGPGQNAQMTPVSNAPVGYPSPYRHGDVPPTDISRQNSAVSELSNVSVPSTTDTDLSRTESLKAEPEQQFNQVAIGAIQNIPSEPVISGGTHVPHPPPPSTQTVTGHQNHEKSVFKQDIPQIPPVTQSNVHPLPGHNNMLQPSQSSGLKPGELPPPPPAHNPSNPQPSLANQLSQSSNAPANSTVSTPPVHSQPQGSRSTNPLLETNPLLSGASHPSAFRSVRGHQSQPPVPATVNPSPPLWSTEVPPLPSNILLAPAAAPSSRGLALTTPSQPTHPIKLDSNLAATIANVNVPPPPTEAAALLEQSRTTAKTQGQVVPNQAVPSSGGQTVPNVDQVTQSMAGLTVGQIPQPTLLPPAITASAPGQQSVTVAPVGSTPQVPVNAVQSLPPLGQPTAQGQMALAASSSAPAIANQSNPVKTVQPVALLAGAQYQPQAPSTSAAQNTSQYQQQQQQQQPGTTQSQQYAPNQTQMPPGQEQWYGHAGQYSYGQHPYQYYNQDYRSQYDYDQYYRQYPKGTYYRDQQRPYSRQGYEHERYRERDPMRSYSRQGYEQERPRSRQGRGYEYGYDAYYKGYNRRDQRQRDYADYEEYNRKRGHHGYDKRYDEWYRNQDYYQQSANRSRGYDQNTSGLDQSRNDSQEQEVNQSKDATDGRQESFSSEFHHTGGDTPERYGANQSSIPASGYGDYGDQYGSRGYDYAGHRDSRGSYDNGYSSTDGTWNQYQYGYDQSYPQQVKPATPSPPERLTPCKFNRPHVVARFSSGGHLIKVMPNLPTEGQPATVEIHSVEEMLEHNEEYNQLKAFPGPLVRNDTHKNDVVRFAIQKAADCRKSTDITDKESAALLWDLMVLLCRQNGTIVGTDISELLLQGHPMTTNIEAAPSQPVTAVGDGDATNDEDGEAAAAAEQRTQVVEQQPKKSTGPDIEKETHRFRELLLFGRKKEALDSAVKGGLWGHALLLACKMDHRTHLSVMTRFANSLPMNDPLQTLYQLMSNRQPAAVTSCTDEKWGDWRPHLSMILSNLISNTDLDVKSITTLGDSLASRGLLCASHFCYLMAQIGMGHYSKKTTKMVLLGASHSLPFKEFVRLPPIQQTEVYEYAQSLANKRYSLPTFQVYKLIYATHLLDYGLVSQALHYCEVIANTIQYSPAYYNLALIDKVSEFSHRLKYHDSQYFDGREVTEPEWLKDLDHIKIQFEEGAIRPSSNNNTPMPWVESYSNLSTMGDSVTSEGLSFEVSRTGVPGGQPRMDTPQSDEYRMGGSVDGQQEHQYGMGQQEQGQEGFDGGQQVQDQMQGGAGGGFSMDPSGYYQPTDGTNADYPAVQTPQQSSSGFDWGTQQQQYPEVGTEANQQMSGNYAHFGAQPSDKTKPPNLDLGASAASTLSEYSTTSAASTATAESPTDTDLVNSGASQAFDYYGMSTNMGNQGNGYPGYGGDQPGGPPSPVKTMTPPDTPMSRTRTRTLSGDSTQMTPTPQMQQKVQQNPEKPKEKKDAKSQKKGGWFSGWFNKGNKEIHLPDDKDKTIQWDEKKKKWVNTAGDEDDSSGPPPPPPTDHELSGGPAPPVAPSAASGPPGAGPPTGAPPGANKFSRKFGRGNYVDIFNQGSTMPAKSSGLPTPSKIFDTLPATNAMPTNFFVPQGGVDQADEAGAGQPQVGNPESRSQTPASQRSRQNSGAQTQANEPPQFFNPNAFGSSNTGSSNFPGIDSGGHQEQTQPPQQIQQVQQVQQEENLSRSSSMSSLSQEVSQHMKNQQQAGQSGWTQEEPSTAAPPPGPAPVTQPMMFNPQQFSQPSFPPQQTPRRGYGARRQYPNQR